MTVEPVINNFTPLMCVLYVIEIFISFLIAYCLGRQLVIRYNKGYMNTFFVSLFFLITFSGTLSTIVLTWWLAVTPVFDNWLTIFLSILWGLVHVCFIVSLGFVGFFVIGDEFKLYFINQDVEVEIPIDPTDTDPDSGTLPL